MRTAARVERVRERALEIAPRAPGYAYVMATFTRDRQHGGGLLAGALAFRLFGALLPLALLLSVLLGYAATVDRAAPDKAGDVTGLSDALLQSIAQSAKLSTGTRWLVGVGAVFALVWAAIWAARAIRAVHSIAWSGRVESYARPVQAALVLLAAIAAFFVVMSAATALLERPGAVGTLLALLELVALFGIWLWVERLLPHAEAPVRALVPGAVIFTVGIVVVHLATVLFIAGKVERASATYGSLGVAFTLLFWLYCASRVMVASAMLNAALWESRPRRPPRPTRTSARP